MGLIQEGQKVAILSDILGDEDHLGDMDFKVCGTDRGVTAIQMDIKIAGLERSILERALQQAREGRLHILGKMMETLPTVRARHQPLGAAHHQHQGEARPDPPRSSAPVARPSRASSIRRAARSMWKTTERSTSPAPTRTP